MQVSGFSRDCQGASFSDLLCDAFTVISYKQLCSRVRGPGGLPGIRTHVQRGTPGLMQLPHRVYSKASGGGTHARCVANAILPHA